MADHYSHPKCPTTHAFQTPFPIFLLLAKGRLLVADVAALRFIVGDEDDRAIQSQLATNMLHTQTI
jgi:hypothetical protein